MPNIIFSPSTLGFYEPSWRDSYVAAGTWPKDGIEISAKLAAEYEGEPPKGQTRGATEDGLPCWVDIPPIPLKDLAEAKRSQIDSALANALRAGMPYTLPDGSEDVIQTRPDEDEANLLGLAIEARDRRAAGDTEANMALRAQSNTVYSLTPEQMIALTDAAKAFKQGLLAKSWQLKDAITAAEAAGDREAIEAVVWEASASAA